MKKTNLILLAVLAVLGSATAWYFLNKDNSTSLEGYDFNFAVKDTADVYKVFLADRDGHQITLTRQDKSAWTVNGKYKARPDAVLNLLDVISRVELKYRLPRQAVPPVVKDIASSGIKVEIYNKRNKLLKAYYVGGAVMDERGTHMIMEGSNEPYVTHIPNFEGSLRVRYFTDEIDWRDRVIYSLKPEDIQQVSVDYPLQKQHAFKLVRAGSDFNIEPFYPVTPKIPQPPVKGLIESFLTGFNRLGIEGFENGFPRIDSLRMTVPFAIISVTDRANVTKTMKLHPIVRRDTPENAATEGSAANVERYFAETSEGDLVMIQHLVWEKIFWAYSGFFPQSAGR